MEGIDPIVAGPVLVGRDENWHSIASYASLVRPLLVTWADIML